MHAIQYNADAIPPKQIQREKQFFPCINAEILQEGGKEEDFKQRCREVSNIAECNE